MSADYEESISQPKLSRYRSVKKSAGKSAPDLLSDQDVNAGNGVQVGGLKRGPSRYRRPQAKVVLDDTEAPAIPPVPREVPISSPRNGRNGENKTRIIRAEDTENLKHKAEALQVEIRTQRSDLERRGPLAELESEFKAQGRRHAQALESAREVSRDEAKRARDGEGIQRARTVPLSRQISDEEAALLKIQKRKDLERLERELEFAKITPPKSPVKERFHLFSRKPKDTPLSSTPTSRRGSSNTASESKKHPAEIKDKPQFIEVGGGGIVPGTDAPISAVNSGERRVLVRCKESSINLPVTPTTTSNDLIYTAANILSQNVDPAKAILLESYTQLGLERGLRRYEHIRDVMNSWDRDTQNSLILEPSPRTYPSSNPFSNPAYLDADSVSSNPPVDMQVYLYHSQKPGKWNKRHVTLLSTGQIYISKNPSAKPSDKDASTICHLSDFDIFIPTSSQARKNLKPPKKFCYAIKSQQKTTFFESTENFVHFFSTDDERLARTWWSAVQKWRSWYFLHKRGGNPPKEAAPTEKERPATRDDKRRPNTRAGGEDSTPYTIGSFGPLLGTADFSSAAAGHTRQRSKTINTPGDMRYDDDDDDDVPLFNRSGTRIIPPKPSSRSKYPPVSAAMTKILHNSTDDENGSSADDQTFAPKGLLGRSYTVKQKEVKEKEKKERPFVEGNNLLNGAGSGGLSRSKSMKRPGGDGTWGEAVSRPKTSSHPNNPTIQRSNTLRSSARKPQPAPTFSDRDRTRTMTASGVADRTLTTTTSNSSTSSSERTRTMTGGGSGGERTRTLTNSSSERTRTMTGKIPPPPLIDLTPKVLEAKQWSREGKGHGVRAPEGTLLVQAARSREDAEGGLGGRVVVPRSYEARSR